MSANGRRYSLCISFAESTAMVARTQGRPGPGRRRQFLWNDYTTRPGGGGTVYKNPHRWGAEGLHSFTALMMAEIPRRRWWRQRRQFSMARRNTGAPARRHGTVFKIGPNGALTLCMHSRHKWMARTVTGLVQGSDGNSMARLRASTDTAAPPLAPCSKSPSSWGTDHVVFISPAQ